MFSYQPKGILDSQNSRVFYTQSLLRETIIEYAEIDLTNSGMDRTNLDLSQTTRLGFGFGRNKRWFIGTQYNLTKSANFDNKFFFIIL